MFFSFFLIYGTLKISLKSSLVICYFASFDCNISGEEFFIILFLDSSLGCLWRGNRISWFKYFLIRLTFKSNFYWDKLTLLWSTAIPILLANPGFNPAFFIYSKVNPLPNLCLDEYLIVCQLTTGLNLSIGIGLIFFAFSFLAINLLFFLAGWLNHHFTNGCQCFLRCGNTN